MITVFWCLILLMLLLAISIVYWPLRSHQSMLVIMPVTLLSVSSLGLYHYWGDSQGLSALYQQQSKQDLIAEFLEEYDSPAQIITMLKTRLQQEPNSARGWYLLGRLYMSQQDYQQASDVFARASKIEPNDLQILMQYAQALYFVQGGDLSGQPTALLTQVLQQAPDHVEALNLMAAGAFQQGNYETAIDYWQQILDQQLPEGQAKEALRQAVASAEKALRDEEKAGKNGNEVQLKLTVRLAADLQAQVAADDVVFIYAKAVAGPAMPLAVTQKLGQDLPFSITLDDTMAMAPSLLLSRFEQVIIFARVAKTGQAQSAKGDLIGQSAVIAPAMQTDIVELLIDSVIT